MKVGGKNDVEEEVEWENLFLDMQVRKILRKTWGTYQDERPWLTLWVFVILLVVFGVATAEMDAGVVYFQVDLRTLGVWSFILALVLLSLLYTLTKVLVVVRWMLYWLLLAMALDFAIYKQTDLFRNGELWLQILLAFLECNTLLFYLWSNFLLPWFIQTKVFRESIGVKNWWQLRYCGEGILQYKDSPFYSSRKSTCSFQGEKNSAGLPHGFGCWVDDNGEVMTGFWSNGHPSGPFQSRESDSGYMLECTAIAFVLASDDTFSSNKLFPSSNQKRARCGLASVECSVSGAFFSHLPKATLLKSGMLYDRTAIAPDLMVYEEQQSGGNLCDFIKQIRTVRSQEKDVQLLIGVRELKGSNSNTEESKAEWAIHVSGHEPESSHIYQKAVEISIDCESEVEGKEGGAHRHDCVPSEGLQTCFAHHESKNHLLPFSLSDTAEERGQCKVNVSELPHQHAQQKLGETFVPKLHVHGWRSRTHSEAILFIPGFNTSLEHSLGRFGQFLAMGRLPGYFKPVVFTWPAGRVVTYFSAKEMASSACTIEAFEEALRQIKESGIKMLHILSHSMGAQVVCAALKKDSVREYLAGNLSVKTVTLLNPDYGLESFLEEDMGNFLAVVPFITVVGNLKDEALFWSEVVTRENSLGRKIHSLHSCASGKLTGSWLKIDAIDTTWMQANVHSLRHSYFSLNNVLVNDLHELLVTGNRAGARTTLLRREKNIFTYCQAPRCVVSD